MSFLCCPEEIDLEKGQFLADQIRNNNWVTTISFCWLSCKILYKRTKKKAKTLWWQFSIYFFY